MDFTAGPSEIAIIADENANPVFIAADMMSQAEHGTGFDPAQALKKNADYIIELAEAEGMRAFALAVKIRK